MNKVFWGILFSGIQTAFLWAIPTILPPLIQTPTINHITLEHAVSLALKHRPEIEINRLLIHELEAKKNEAWSGYLPKAGVTFYSGAQIGNCTDKPLTRLKATQLLFDFAGPQLKAEQTHHAITQQTHSLETTKNAIRLAVEQAFIECWKLQEQEPLIKKLNQYTYASFNQASQQHVLELADNNTLLTKADEQSQAINTLHDYQENMNIALDNFSYLTGQTCSLNSASIHFAYQPTIQTTLPSLQHCIQTGFNNRPEIKHAQKQIDIEDVSSRQASRSILPKVELEASCWHKSGINNCNTKKNFNQISGTLQWQFLDGGTAKYQSKQALARKTQATLLVEQKKQQIKLEIETAYRNLSKGLARLTAAEITKKRSDNIYNQKKEEFLSGLTDSIAYEQAEYAWAQEQFQILLIKAAVLSQQAVLNYTCGYTPSPHEHST